MAYHFVDWKKRKYWKIGNFSICYIKFVFLMKLINVTYKEFSIRLWTRFRGALYIFIQLLALNLIFLLIYWLNQKIFLDSNINTLDFKIFKALIDAKTIIFITHKIWSLCSLLWLFLHHFLPVLWPVDNKHQSSFAISELYEKREEMQTERGRNINRIGREKII